MERTQSLTTTIKALVGVLLLLAVCLGIWHIRQQAIERRFDQIIIRIARAHGLDPALVKAVIWVESRFRPHVVGAAGEIGLMQVREAAFEDWKRVHNDARSRFSDLFKPEFNIRVGTWYLARAVSRYLETDNPVVYGLAAYNAGEGNVRRWARGKAQTNSVLFLKRIDNPITRHYIPAVLTRAAYYRARLRSN